MSLVTPETVPPKPLARSSDRVHDWLWLALSVGILAASLSLQVVDSEYVALRVWPDQPLPHSCLTRRWFNLDCPGCGLTRSFVLLGEGRLVESFLRHPVGILLFGTFLFQIPYRIWHLLWPDSCRLPTPWVQAFLWLLAGLLIVNWAGKLLLNLF